MKTYYEILGVQPSDGTDVIKQAYRKLAKANHPDLHPGDTAAEERFKEIGEAWEVLSDADKRQKYDAKLAGGEPAGPGGATNRPKSAPVGKVNLDDLMRGFDSYFGAEKISGEKKPNASSGPINTEEMFQRFMGFRGPKK